jgi:peptidoglycan/LPS O-acetylase OafA/YrhL
MSPVSPWPALLAFLIAYGCAWLIARKFPPDISAHHRFQVLDGLRGYLAFAVFLHHSVIWYYYLRSHLWDVPPSRLYTHFGQSAVALFFMITGFLFFSKLLDSRSRRIDWIRLYVSRVLRLTPLYFFVVGLLVLVVAIVSDFSLREPLLNVLRQIVCWSSFTVLGGPDINMVERTTLILAGVTWSLPYEWMFYLLLPLLFLMRGGWPGWPWLLLGLAAIGVSIVRHPPLVPFTLFLGGIAAALLVRWPAFIRLCHGPLAALLALGCLIGAVTGFGTVYQIVPTLLLSIAFAIICCGNSLFGILLLPASRVLGEISYSIYLLHGLFLYCTFKLGLGDALAAGLSVYEHWAVVLGLAPVLVGVAFVTFSFIEAPAMRQVECVQAWLRRWSGRKALG